MDLPLISLLALQSIGVSHDLPGGFMHTRTGGRVIAWISDHQQHPFSVSNRYQTLTFIWGKWRSIWIPNIVVILVATGILPGTVKSSQTSSNSKKRNILWTSLLFQFQFSQLIEQTPTRNHHQKRFKRATKTAFFRVPKPSEKRSRMMFIHWLRPQTSASWHSLTSWWFEWQKVQQIWKWSDIYIYTYLI